MPDHKRIKDKYYISATSSFIDPCRLVLKDDNLFGVFDRFGDILPLGKNEQGLYYNGTRFLSLYELKMNGLRPLFLNSSVDEDNILLTVDLTNPDIYSKGKLIIKKDSVHIMRSRLLCENQCFEEIRLRNFGQETIQFVLEIEIDSDFKDIFEVRGLKRKKRGEIFPVEFNDKEIFIKYIGLDGINRICSLKFTKKPDNKLEKRLFFNFLIKPRTTENLSLTISCISDKKKKNLSFLEVLKRAKIKFKEKNNDSANIYTSNEQFNESIKRALSDINIMLTKTTYGYYPYGGIPWFCTPFGRDAIITALECLWIKPNVAKGVLKYLSALQSNEFDKFKSAQPGKIIHEVRGGEMASLREIPFGRYYGSVDSTPLYIMLAGAYWKRTGDIDLIKKIWRNINKAIVWLEKYGDIDGDGFIEYAPDETGLRNQGWKDSQDSVFHADGSLAEGPIALSEIQGYVYAAKREAATLSRLVGNEELSNKLLKESEELKAKFNKIFWDESINSYVLALDGEKKPCKVIASNAGHCLFTGIAEADKALKVAKTLTSKYSFSGWGIRTISSNEILYNPMSYHNGSVWPHDNALISAGFALYGLKEQLIKVFTGIFDVSLFMEFQRLPELFCGFHRRKGVPPTLYPVACTPHAWASGSLLLMLQSCLGISFNADKNIIKFNQPLLPEFLNSIHIKNLIVTGKKSIELIMRRYGEDVTIEVLRKPEDINVLIVK